MFTHMLFYKGRFIQVIEIAQITLVEIVLMSFVLMIICKTVATDHTLESH